jgi:hypothetical protein
LGFFDVIYLGVFIIVSPAFDSRFYDRSPPFTLRGEISNAIGAFHTVINFFSQNFTLLLDGEVISASYVVNRVLGEFSAAAVTLSQAIDLEGNGLGRYQFQDAVELIFQEFYPEVKPYYLYCIQRSHGDFLWTGPDVEILRSSSSLLAVLSELTSGTLFDFPRHSIYKPDAIAHSKPPTPEPLASQPSTSSLAVENRKRRVRGNSDGGDAIVKRVRQQH